jgi:hypothetical protein
VAPSGDCILRPDEHSRVPATKRFRETTDMTFGRVGVEEALAIARRETEARHWRWSEPVSVRRGLLAYHITAGSGPRRGTVVVIVWAWSGGILAADFRLG